MAENDLVEEEVPGVVEDAPIDLRPFYIKVQGNKMYLSVAGRLVWFRKVHPDWGIETEAVEINMEKQFAIFRATITNAQGKVIATATKTENVKGFGDYLEKAETGSVGRALAYCGFGTANAPELDEGSNRLADSPQSRGNYPPSNSYANRAPSNYSATSGGSRPTPAAPVEIPAIPAEGATCNSAGCSNNMPKGWIVNQIKAGIDSDKVQCMDCVKAAKTAVAK